MKCSVQGCPGRYESREIVHTVKRGDDVFVFENASAEVCDVCSDTLLAPQTVRHLERLVREKAKPGKHAPLYEYR